MISKMIVALAFVTGAEGEPKDTIIPLPKEIRELGEPTPLDGFRIVAASDERSQIGAAQVNQRIVSLGGKPLTVIRWDGRLPDGRLIVVAPCTAKQLETMKSSLEVTPTDPGVQGYVIRTDGNGGNLKLMLVGSDSLGTLYAAVTCRQLIVKRDGRLLLQPALVRDWPDFKTRCHTSLRQRQSGDSRAASGAHFAPHEVERRYDRWRTSESRSHRDDLRRGGPTDHRESGWSCRCGRRRRAFPRTGRHVQPAGDTEELHRFLQRILSTHNCRSPVVGSYNWPAGAMEMNGSQLTTRLLPYAVVFITLQR
ncbi:MAG: hypothetical protein ACYTG0_34055 [Planctomycetota bacterium]